MAKTYTPLSERLNRFILELPTTGCWLFTGKLDKDGYGIMHNRSGGSDYKTHRLSWQLNNGEIPAGMEIAHHCDVRCCVNPSHLYVATHKQNIEDRTRRKREPRGSECSWSKVTKEIVLKIRSGEIGKKDVNISASQFYRIKNRECWTHV